MNVALMVGWKARFSLSDGFSATYQWYLEHEACI